ncbi:hypothetical protein BU23DRAFT_362773, partial [Bimuria novae-zelandiae CBS 107.79]
YCNWALKWLSRNALFVFTDETYISAGGRPHKRKRITIERGQPADSRGFYTDPIYFKLMFWGAMCEDLDVERPCLIWEWETPQERGQHQFELDLENLTQHTQATFQQIKARQEDGAPAHTKFEALCHAEYKYEGFIRAPHPNNSPDLNQIEPIWDYIKDQLQGRF